MIKRQALTSAALSLVAVLTAGYASPAGADVPSGTSGPIVWGDCPAGPAGMKIDPEQKCGTLKVP
ncbi:hypothetical protein ACTMTF_08460 [Nonomuraea sp. ZG12]|uniref:hypothetical protein n=1 Tax=Nonomuraea sp. ZG12 TaxID=3452207 RepID=UPI003F8BEB50